MLRVSQADLDRFVEDTGGGVVIDLVREHCVVRRIQTLIRLLRLHRRHHGEEILAVLGRVDGRRRLLIHRALLLVRSKALLSYDDGMGIRVSQQCGSFLRDSIYFVV